MDFQRSEWRVATIESIEDGTCTYVWPPPPTSSLGNSDGCPRGAVVGATVEVWVDPGGTVWTTQASMIGEITVAAGAALIIGVPLVIVGLVVRRKGRRA